VRLLCESGHENNNVSYHKQFMRKKKPRSQRIYQDIHYETGVVWEVCL